MDRTSPISLDVVGDIKLGADNEAEQRTLSMLIQQGQRADSARESWLTEQQRLTRLRYGVRRPKSFPWPNCSNISIPFIDQIIRKFKPVFMRLIAEPDPVVEFRGEDPESAVRERRAETLYQWLFKLSMNSLEVMAYVIDLMLHRGFCFVQVGWEYQTEYECRVVNLKALFPGDQPPDAQSAAQRLYEEYDLRPGIPRIDASVNAAAQAASQGADFVKLSFPRVVTDRPAMWERDPITILAPPRCTDPRNAEWVIVQHLVTERQIRQREADGFFIKGVADKIVQEVQKEAADKLRGARNETGLSPSLYKDQMAGDDREKIWGTENEDKFLIWEIYHWHDAGRGPERTVTFVHPRTKTKCRSAPFFFPFHCWPLVRFDFEKISRRWNSSRGVPALLEGLQREINAQHNARIDHMTITNAPCFQMPSIANFKARNLTLKPGEILQVPLGAQITPLVQDRGGHPDMLREENLLRSLGENYIGVFDAAITSPTSNTQARTATEIQAIAQYTAATSTLDAVLFQLSMRELHTMIWQLWLEFGPEEVSLKVASTDPNRTEDETIQVRKADIAGNYKLVPTGTIANTNRALELSHAREAMGAFINDQSGYINDYELRRWYFNLLDYRWARRILNPPAMAAEQQTLKQAAAALQQDPRLAQAMNASTMAAPPNEPEETPVPEMGGSSVT